MKHLDGTQLARLEELLRAQQRELRDVEAALGRLASGTLGICSDCAREIDYERLEASPAATRCIRCQERREKTLAHEATPTL